MEARRMRSSEPAAAGRYAELIARHGPPNAEALLGGPTLADLTSQGSTTVEAVVVAGDLRLSTLVLKEAVQPSLFARFIIGFTEAVRTLVGANDGWFDKFTGDGFIVFWVAPQGARLDPRRVAVFCQNVLPAADHLITKLRRNSRNFPVGVGLSLGVDAGPCELAIVGDTLTLIGSPIIGATRMVAGASANQAVVNIALGEELYRDRDALRDEGIRVERTVVRTKEYPDGQEAFELVLTLGAPVGAPVTR
jgi:class 3 adenylate cyclase